MNTDLPTRLGKSPLIDSVFEVRFSGAPSLSAILTGVIYSGLGCTELAKLPPSEIPESIRAADPNLRYVPLNGLSWGNYSLGVGDNIITLTPKHPYPGWAKFQDKIRELIDFIGNLPFIENYERYSFKYIDILEERIHKDISDTLALTFTLGKRDCRPNNIQIRTEFPIEHGVHIVQIVGNATARLPDGRSFTGIMVDIDSIHMIEGGVGKAGADMVLAGISELHSSNKALFFELLTANGLARLEPQYG